MQAEVQEVADSREATADTTAPQPWDCARVQTWLRQAGFDEACGAVAEHSIDGAMLVQLDHEGIKALGVVDPLRRASLLKAIQILDASETGDGQRGSGLMSRTASIGKSAPAPLMCKYHPDEASKVYCKTCKEICCYACVMYGTHKEKDGHDSDLIVTVAASDRVELQKQRDMVAAKGEELNQSLKVVSDMMTSVTDRVNSVKTEFSTHCEAIKSHLQAKLEEVSACAEQLGAGKLEKLKEQFQELSSTKQQCQAATEKIDEALSHSDTAMLASSAAINVEANEALKCSPTLTPCVDEKLNVDLNSTLLEASLGDVKE